MRMQLRYPDGVDFYGNREISSDVAHQARVMAFERRVLEEARNHRTPLLERVKFLAIVGGNLDDLMMVHGRAWASRIGARRVARKTHALLRNAAGVLQRELLPALATAGLAVVDYGSLTPCEQAAVDRRFDEDVLPRLTPTREGERAFAAMPGLGLNLAVVFESGGAVAPLAAVRLPDELPPLMRIPGRRDAGRSAEDVYVWLHQVVAANVHRLFAGARIRSTHPFRILRDANVAFDRSAAGPLPGRTIDAVRQRDTNPVVMIVVERAAEPLVIERLGRALDAPDDAVVRARHVIDFKRLWDVAQMPRADLRYPDFVPQRAARAGACLFTSMRRHDILLHHPFESFEPVIDFARQAAADPAVERISATLYRTDRGDSPIAGALLEAARRGKDVRVAVELKARFDEKPNAEWARALTAAGAQVVHTPATLKVHAKLLLVERREAGGLRRYAHVSSGNYNAFTARVYTDFGLLTCDEAITSDVAELFDYVRGEVPAPMLRAALAAPFGLREGLRALVEREMAWAERGEAAHVILKMNALLDAAAIALLERAARAGVQVDLIVRGASALVPSTPRIRVRSIVGRFLEHSRAWYFRNGGAEEVFIGSADLRPRNFDRRVELVVPIRDRGLAHRLRYEILDTYLADTLAARELMANGRYRRLAPRTGEPGVSAQARLLHLRSNGELTGHAGDDHRASHGRDRHAGTGALCLA